MKNFLKEIGLLWLVCFLAIYGVRLIAMAYALYPMETLIGGVIASMFAVWRFCFWLANWPGGRL